MSFQVMLEKLAGGFGQTCLIFALTLVISLPVGMIVYFGRVCRFKPVSWLVKIFISIMRGTPLMLQLLIWYFAPYYLWGMNIGGYKFTAVSYTHLDVYKRQVISSYSDDLKKVFSKRRAGAAA